MPLTSNANYGWILNKNKKQRTVGQNGEEYFIVAIIIFIIVFALIIIGITSSDFTFESGEKRAGRRGEEIHI